VTSRARFASLFPFLCIALRALSHAHPTPLPSTSGFFDAEDRDDILQTIRIGYTASNDLGHVVTAVFKNPTGHVTVATPILISGVFVATAHSRAPPRA
jgi:hypothetical protein